MWLFLLLLLISLISPTEAVCNAIIDSFGPDAQGLEVEIGSFEGVFDEPVLPGINLLTTLLPMGEITNLEEVYQYGTGSYSVTSDNVYKVSTGTGAFGYGVVRSASVAPVIPGSSMIARFSVAFPTSDTCVNCVLAAGPFQSTDGLLVGIKNSSGFSIAYQRYGNLESRTLTLATAATSATSVSVTVSGITVNIALTIATSSVNAFEIAAGLSASVTLRAMGYTFYQNTNMVVAVGGNTDEVVGTYSYGGGGGSTGSWVQNIAATPKTETWVALADFNGGNDLSWLNITGLNVFQIVYGTGATNIRYFVLNPTGVKWVLMHTITQSGLILKPNFRNPNMKIGWIAYSVPSGVNYDVYGASASISRIGTLLPPTSETWSVSTTVVAVPTNAEKYVFSVRNRRVFNNLINQNTMVLKSISIVTQSTRGAIFRIYKGCAVGGTTNWIYRNFVNSVAEYDFSGTSCANGQEQYTATLGVSGYANLDISDLSITVVPTEDITIMAITTAGTASDVTVGLTWIEPR